MAPSLLSGIKNNHKAKGFQINKHDVLSGKSCRYRVEKVLGQGTFGIVVACINLNTREKVAVKIVRKDLEWAGKKEVAALEKISTLDQDRNNLVRFNEHFKHNKHACLVFEMLDISLYDFMKERHFQPLSVSEIRIIAQQMLVALNALKSNCMAHADVKPDNIMLINHILMPFKLKLVDFGLTIPVTKLLPCSLIQVLGYRAPEVILGLPLNEAVDMWALGCVLAFLYLGKHLYPRHSKYEVMRAIVQMQGYPGDHLLDAGISTKDYFCKNQDSSTPSWRLNSEAEYEQATGCKTECRKWIFENFTCLDDMVKSRPEIMDITDCEDTQAFLSLLKRMLHVDPEKRITPSDALGHRFITTKHFSCNTNDEREYVRLAHLIIKESQLEQPSVEFERFLTSSEVRSGNALSITSLDDSFFSVEETSAGSNNGPPATAGLDKTNAAGQNHGTPALAYRTTTIGNCDAKSGLYHTSPDMNNEKSSGRNDAASSDNGISNLDGSNSSFVEVKCREKWFKRIQGFSRMMTCVICCRVDVEEDTTNEDIS